MISRKTAGKIPKHVEAEKYTSTLYKSQKKNLKKITKDYELNESKILQTLPGIGTKHLRGWTGRRKMSYETSASWQRHFQADGKA